MRPSDLPRLALAALLLAFLLPGREAEAVIPSAFGPIQALLVILPQLLVALAAAAVALLKPRTYRLLFAYLWAHKALFAALVALVALLVWGPWRGASAGTVTAEQTGAPWAAFRGGPLRSGAVAGSKGPVERPVVAWKEGFGGGANVDSSPAVVGNRVYVGLGSSGFGGARGSIACLDAGTGAVVWTWDGKGELDPPLKPVFSSPAVSVDPARLVIGEGYHEDRDCRFICLDLSGGKPKLAWALQTTSHVESTPCIHEGRAFIGAGDDGLWCLDLASGRVLWRAEGDPAYGVADGPKANALAALEGKSVTATGRVRREGVGAKGKDDAGTPVIEIRDFKECSGPPVTASDPGPERTVTGKVVRKGGRVLLEVPWHNPDSESCPIGAGPYVLFGSGIGGQRVNCVEAATGKVVWQSPTPYPAFGPPTVAGDRVLIGVGNGNFLASAEKPAGAVLCFSLRDGSILWRVDAADTILGAVAVDGNRGYACGRDGQVTVIDLEKGEIASRLAVGSPMVCSPALAGDALYVTTGAGRLLSVDRKGGAVRWTFTLSADEQVFSSPAVAGGSVFVGTRGRGLFCLSERAADAAVAGPPRPWLGAGGTPNRNGAADDRGLPAVEGDTADLKWPTPAALQAPVARPPLACGKSVYVAFDDRLVQVDAATGRIAAELKAKTLPYAAGPGVVHAWALGDGPAPDGRGWAKFEPPAAWPYPRGDFDNDPRSHRFRLRHPLIAHDLVIEASGFDLECVSAEGTLLWKTLLEYARPRPPALLDDKLFIATETVDEPVKSSLECRRLVDGSPVWKVPLNARTASHPVAHGDWVVIATTDDKIAAFNVADGKGIEPVVIDGKAATPALWKNTLIVAGGTRIAAYDLSTRDWVWNYKDQDDIGLVVGQPVICNETIWVGTTKKGLLAIGVPAKGAKK